jgi:hypothetical protein
LKEPWKVLMKVDRMDQMKGIEMVGHWDMLKAVQMAESSACWMVERKEKHLAVLLVDQLVCEMAENLARQKEQMLVWRSESW